MIKHLKYFLVLLLTGAFYTAFAQAPQAGAKLDRTTIKIGEQTLLHLSIKLNKKDKAEFPVVPDSIAEKIVVVGVKTDTIADKADASLETIHKAYTVTGFDSGQYVIPSYAFKTGSGVVNSPSVTLNVTTLKVDTTKAFFDIKQPLAIDYTFWDWLRDNWQWVVGIFLVLLLIAGIIYYLKTRPKKEVVVEPPAPILPPHIIALQKLAELRDKKLYQQEVKTYHIELSEVMREYLEKRYAIKAHEQTTDEIFDSLRSLQITADNKDTLRQVLVLADLVKFAKEKPLPFENEQSMDKAIGFVNNTKPAFVPQADKEEGTK